MGRDEGIALSWVGTGRLNFSMDFTTADLENVTEAMVRAGKRMQEDGWWLSEEEAKHAESKKKTIQLKLVKEILTNFVQNIPKRFNTPSNLMPTYVGQTEGKKSK